MKPTRNALFLVVLLVLAGTAPALALPVTLSYTADNVVVNGWVISDGTVTPFTTVGSNAGNWRIADTYALDLVAGQTYQIIWQTMNADPNGQPLGPKNPGGLLAQIDLPDQSSLLSSSSWEVALLEQGLILPANPDFNTWTWFGAYAYGENSGPSIWTTVLGSPVAGIDEDAHWIWWENNFGNIPPDVEDSVFVRATFDVPAPIPDPGTIYLLGSGLIGLAALRKRIK